MAGQQRTKLAHCLLSKGLEQSSPHVKQLGSGGESAVLVFDLTAQGRQDLLSSIAVDATPELLLEANQVLDELQDCVFKVFDSTDADSCFEQNQDVRALHALLQQEHNLGTNCKYAALQDAGKQLH